MSIKNEYAVIKELYQRFDDESCYVFLSLLEKAIHNKGGFIIL